MSKKIIPAVLAVVIAIAIYVNERRTAAPRDENPLAQVTESAAISSANSPSESKQTAASREETADNPSGLAFELPDTQTYRQQVAAHPHGGLPPVLREFSRKMAPLMESAHESEARAREIFPQLEQCALSGASALLQARSICAVNALDLSNSFPDALSKKGRDLRAKLPPEVAEMVDLL